MSSGGPREAGGVVLVGNPNVGKSVLFGALTGTYVTVSNYPGTTVEVSEGTAVVAGAARSSIRRHAGRRLAASVLGGRARHPRHPALRRGRGGRRGRGREEPRAGPAALAARSSPRPGLPLVALPQHDGRGAGARLRDRRRGASRRASAWPSSRRSPCGARGSRGSPRPSSGAARAPFRVAYPDPIERAVDAIGAADAGGARFPRAPWRWRRWRGDQTLTPVAARAPAPTTRWRGSRRCGSGCAAFYRETSATSIQDARLRAAGELVREVARGASRPPAPARAAFAALARRATTHPVWGVPILARGALPRLPLRRRLRRGTLVDLLENGLFGKLVSPAATTARRRARSLGRSCATCSSGPTASSRWRSPTRSPSCCRSSAPSSSPSGSSRTRATCRGWR